MIQVDLQRACASASTTVPELQDFTRWVGLAVCHDHGDSAHIKTGHTETEIELGIRLVDEEESRALNRQYRGKDRPTNILSFPADFPKGVEVPLLGDLVICVPLVEQEAGQQQNSPQAPWAHLVIHGTLHLLGYDHMEAQESAVMEAREVELLRQLGYPDPYL